MHCRNVDPVFSHAVASSRELSRVAATNVREAPRDTSYGNNDGVWLRLASHSDASRDLPTRRDYQLRQKPEFQRVPRSSHESSTSRREASGGLVARDPVMYRPGFSRMTSLQIFQVSIFGSSYGVP